MKLASIFSVLMILTTLSCTHTVCDTDEGGPYNLQGKWKFKEFYVDPGNGSGKWQPAPSGQTYIEFKTDGTISSDLPLFTNSRYENPTDSSFQMRNGGTYAYTIYYTIEGNRLELNPLCFEGCGYRFKRQ